MAFRQTWESIAAGYGYVKIVVLRLVKLCHPSQLDPGDTTKYAENSGSETEIAEDLHEAAERIAKEFDFPADDLRRAVQGFIQQLSQYSYSISSDFAEKLG